MAELNVNVNDEKMAAFSEYVKQFGKETKADCETLKAAMKKLQSASSDEELYQTSKTVEKIDDIITDAQPTINQLSNKIDEYVAFVRRLKSAARS